MASPAATAAPTATASPAATPQAAKPKAVDGAVALQHVLALAQQIGPRVASEAGEARAAEYLAQQLRSYGYQAVSQEFQFNQESDRSTLGVVSPQARSLTARALLRSAQGEATATLVAAGLGRQGDFPAQGLGGGIALIQRGEITFTEKVANAAAAGASGLIVYNDRPGLLQGALQATSRIPAVGISQEDGEELLRLLAQGPVTATVRARVEQVAVTSRNVVARPADGRCRVVVGGHYDSVAVSPGGNDNASGTAAVLEIARVVAGTPAALGACFVAFGAEEEGLFGSQHFVTSLSAEERRQLLGMINLDVVGAGDRWLLIGSPALVAQAAEGARKLGIETEAGSLPTGFGSDHQSFLAVGVPVVFITIVDRQGSYPDIHTPQDTASIVQPRLLAQAAQMGLLVLQQLLGVGG